MGITDSVPAVYWEDFWKQVDKWLGDEVNTKLLDTTVPATKLHVTGATMNLVERAVSGLFEDPDDSQEVTKAARSDDAEIDLCFWAVGGPGAHMDRAREILQRTLHYWWLKGLKRKAYDWFNQQKDQDSL